MSRKGEPRRTERKKALAKQIEGILTPEQLETYKSEAFASAAYDLLFEPEVVKKIATTQQREQLRQIDAAATHRAKRQGKQWFDRLLSVLDSREQTRIRTH